MSLALAVGDSWASADSRMVIVSLGPKLLRVVKSMARLIGFPIYVEVVAVRSWRGLGVNAPIYKPTVCMTMVEEVGSLTTMLTRSASSVVGGEMRLLTSRDTDEEEAEPMLVNFTRVDWVKLVMAQVGVQVLEDPNVAVRVVLLTDRLQYFIRLISTEKVGLQVRRFFRLRDKLEMVDTVAGLSPQLMSLEFDRVMGLNVRVVWA